MIKTFYHTDTEKLRHLNATIRNFLPKGRGNCIQRSVAMVMDVPTARLVIATVNSNPSYLHAWVHDRGMYYDPSCFEEDGGLRPYYPDAYIERQNARDLRIVGRKWVLDFARRGSLSKWMIRDDDTYHKLPGVMGHVLLDELHIPYHVDDNGCLLPVLEAEDD